MFGLSSEKFFILLVLALFILGPDKLPQYAKGLANLVKSVKRMADGAKSQLKEELGDEYEEVDWKKLDPRQYDPRRIIREALTEDDSTPVTGGQAFNRAAKARLPKGEKPPFDSEAT